jgi:ech hydrogenase subunit E
MPQSVIPFGPQHPVLPEPLHLQLTFEDEVVTAVQPALGFVHRGLERMTDRRDFQQMQQVVERVCGICSTIHGLCYAQALEKMMSVESPPRARFLRVVWSELHRLQSHLLWLGLFADSFGFESLFMECWKIREKILDLNQGTTGNRVIISVNALGGVRRDLDTGQVDWILDSLRQVERRFTEVQKVFLRDYTIRQRTAGKGVLTREQAYTLGAVGPVLRASGVPLDARKLGYAAFHELAWEPVVETDGDCLARLKVRLREARQSVDLIRQALALLPPGEIRVKVKGFPAGEVFFRVEQPRGELLYYIKAGGRKFLDRLRIRTPTFANLPALLTLLPGLWLSDVPVVVLSIDPCISCTER